MSRPHHHYLVSDGLRDGVSWEVSVHMQLQECFYKLLFEGFIRAYVGTKVKEEGFHQLCRLSVSHHVG